jgi:hypothetical protein
MSSTVAGVAFVADSYNDHIRRVLPDGTVTTLPGTLNHPGGVAVSAKGEVYIADTGNHRICKLTPDTTEAGVTPKYTFAVISGTGTAGFADKSGVLAQFDEPRGLAVGGDGVQMAYPGVSSAIVQLFEGLLLLTVLAGGALARYRLVPAKVGAALAEPAAGEG